MKTLLAVLLFASCAFAQVTVSADCQQATTGIAYSCQLAASQPGAVWTVAGGVLPPGLSLSQGGLVSGTPSSTGSYTATVQATVPNSGTATLTISVVAPPPPPPPPATGTPCPQVSNNVKWPKGYAMYNRDFGGKISTVGYIRYVSTQSGTAIGFKWYNSADSHALRNACSGAYGSSAVSPCVAACGDPKYRYSAPPTYSKACPNGWDYYAHLCALDPTACYSGGTGGHMIVSFLNNALTMLAQAVIDQPTVKYGFRAAYPWVYFNQGAYHEAGKEYYLKVENTDPDPKANFFSWNFWTPNNLFTIAQVGSLLIAPTTIGGKSGVANAVFMDTPASAIDTKFQPIFLVSDAGTCSDQGF